MSYEAGIFNNYQDYHLIHNTQISTIFLPSIIVVFINEFDIFTTIIVVKMFFAEVCLSLFLSFLSFTTVCTTVLVLLNFPWGSSKYTIFFFYLMSLTMAHELA